MPPTQAGPGPETGRRDSSASGRARRRTMFDIQMEQQLRSIRMANRDPQKTDVLQGTLDLMVLQTLATMGPLHGYAIAARLEQVSSRSLQLNGHSLSGLDASGAARVRTGEMGNDRE